MTFAEGSRSAERHVGWPRTLLSDCRTVVGLACLVFVLEELMHRTGFFNQVWQAIWWPTNGLALALMVRSERRRWPLLLGGVLLGSLAGEIEYGSPWTANLVNAVANAVGPLVGAFALPRLRRLEDWLQEPHLVSRFVLFALLLGPLLSANLFASYQILVTPGADFSTLLQIRADSDMLGYAIFTPLVLVLGNRELYRELRLYKLPLAVLLVVVVGATTWLVFQQSSFALTFVLVSVMVLACIRLGFSASVVAVNLLAVLATIDTMHGHGPLTLGGGAVMAHRIFLLQAFLALTMVTVFSISVMQIERMAYQTKLQLAYKEMEKLATTDTLTGVGNRRRFEDALDAEWVRAQRSGDAVAVLMIDADHFKSYNDSYGHPAGDACLRTIATAMQRMELRSTDLIARYGGEEFVCLLPGTSLGGAAQIAETIRERIAALYGQPDCDLLRNVTVSIGCAALTPGIGLEASLLVARSDRALYRAKQNGRNRVELAEAAAETEIATQIAAGIEVKPDMNSVA